MQRGFKTRAENKALDIRRELNLAPIDPLPARAMLSYLDVIVTTPSQVPGMTQTMLTQLLKKDRSSWSALTFTIDGSIFLIHNDSHSQTRTESNLMHEVAHLLCKHSPSQLINHASFPFLVRTFDGEQEEEAAWLGACLQIPRKALLHCISRELTNDEIAMKYGASKALVRFRKNVTGVDLQIKRARAFSY